jgi:hypothetical protein
MAITDNSQALFAWITVCTGKIKKAPAASSYKAAGCDAYAFDNIFLLNYLILFILHFSLIARFSFL